jgi:hypothetical protein
MNCCICCPVKNCAPYIEKVIDNMHLLGSIFDDYEIIIFYDNSNDGTIQKLINYAKKSAKVNFYVNPNDTTPYRTHNIANARNFLFDYVKKRIDKYNYFIMMDGDDVNCKNCNPEIIRKYLTRDDWDALSFNTSPKYYDIWALNIWPYCFSYDHFNNNDQFYGIIQNYIVEKLNKLKPGQLLPCISSFNGMSIYKTEKFLNCYYDGRIRIDLIPKRNMLAHMKAANSGLVFKKYKSSDCRYEDCEHRAFHIMARQKNGARIMISSEVIFT